MRILLALPLALSLAATPLWAQEGDAPGSDGQAEQGQSQDGKGDLGRGAEMMQEGGKLILRGLMSQMEPKMRALTRQLFTLMDSLDAYELPEMLPNGDIIIRRKVPLVPVPPGAGGNDIDL
ncbi:AAA+ family ATPase [Acidimangrovimonas pyrenivorans]|uniref:AAA+ family ATPase n=1 Tax=Acidimangrovimonas pyrenivorans TaxID=2030798 RepID=A0ABV7ABJ2_9RHOB